MTCKEPFTILGKSPNFIKILIVSSFDHCIESFIEHAMTSSKYLKYTLCAAIGFFVGSEVTYWLFAKPLNKKLVGKGNDEEINEIFFTKQPVNKASPFLKNLSLREDCQVYEDILSNILRSATKSIHLLMYIFTSLPLAEALVDRKNKGVEVLLVVDRSMENSSSFNIQKLLHAGVTVKIRDDTTMHNKVVLIDVPYDEMKRKIVTPASGSNSIGSAVRIPRNGLTITGSLNWTREGLLNNEENFSVRSNKDICETSARAFYNIWNSPQSRMANYH